MKIKDVPIEDLNPSEYNPRALTEGVTRVSSCNITKVYHISNMNRPPLNEIFKPKDKEVKRPSDV